MIFTTILETQKGEVTIKKLKVGEVTLTNNNDTFTTAILKTQIRGSNSYK